MMGHRSIYHDGWRAVCPWPGPSFTEAGKFFGVPISGEDLTKLDATGWELYHVAADFAENYNVADQHRDKLIEMISLWYIEAGKYNVMPIDSRGATRVIDPRPQATLPRNRYVFFPGTQAVPGSATVNVINRAHSITAEVDIPETGAEGVLISYGGNEGGYSFYVQDGAGMYAFENQAQGGLDSYGEALWWTAMVMTTMGSKYWPETLEGRVLCFFLALYAFAVFGYVTATLATFFVGRDAQDEKGELAGSGELAAMREELRALRMEIRASSQNKPEK